MAKSFQLKRFRPKLRRRTSSFLGILAILFQMAMPFSHALAATLPSGPSDGLTPEVICGGGGQLSSISGEQKTPERQTMACEFCLLCQLVAFEHLRAPKIPDTTTLFTLTQIFWAGHRQTAIHGSADYAVRPVRAPPANV